MPDKLKKGETTKSHRSSNDFRIRTPDKTRSSEIKEKAAKAAISRRISNGLPGLDWSISEDVVGKNRQLATTGVYFCCPSISNEVLTKREWKEKIRNHLKAQLSRDRGKSAALMIHTLNADRVLVNSCVETICTYLNNLISSPDEPKFRKIRKDNKVFSCKVLPLEGALEFLYAAGFEMKTFLIDDKKEAFLVFDDKKYDKKHLQDLVDELKLTEPIHLQVHRDTTILLADQAINKVELPEDFYNRTTEDLRREQARREENLNLSLQLRTKAMRERQEDREKRKYKYSLIRVRFPDNTFLQGTFGVNETLRSVREFVKDKLSKNGNFTLVNSLGRTLSETDDNKTLFDLKLLPAVLLTFIWGQGTPPQNYLKSRYLRKIKQ
ncbi:UBX domain-containing protein 6-like [Cimex lectularius]|uniref:UBX domain-containing protein n=1 Tax=Cimex lectularius TaxID=79782 RepID=A0A8I6SCB7_CIMLE|nr:UBX domain-containing protein 6-like [Cimex lectularius]